MFENLYSPSMVEENNEKKYKKVNMHTSVYTMSKSNTNLSNT